MSLAPPRADGDSQQRMFEALRRISEENTDDNYFGISSHAMLGTSFFSEENMLVTTDFEPTIAVADAVGKDSLSIGFEDHSESVLSYEPIGSSEALLQVDQNGSKVEDESSTAWVPASILPDVPRSVSTTACSAIGQPSTGAPAKAAVFAAAVTAAMIVDHQNSAPKRPRAVLSDCDDDYLGDNDNNGHSTDLADIADDNTTEASLEDSDQGSTSANDSNDMNISPRAVIVENIRVSAPAPPKMHPPPVKAAQKQKAASPPPRVVDICHSLTRVDVAVKNRHGRPIHPEPLIHFPQLHEVPRNALLSRKRRAEAMERFRRKKAVRCYGRRVRYQIRKRIATTRPRVNGRFARRADLESQPGSKKATDRQ